MTPGLPYSVVLKPQADVQRASKTNNMAHWGKNMLPENTQEDVRPTAFVFEYLSPGATG